VSAASGRATAREDWVEDRDGSEFELVPVQRLVDFEPKLRKSAGNFAVPSSTQTRNVTGPAPDDSATVPFASPPAAVSVAVSAVAAQPIVRPSFTVTLKVFSVACGSAPPPTLVPRPVRSKPLAPAPSGPSAMVKVSPPVSGTPSTVASSVSSATRAPASSKRRFGVSVVAPVSVTPVLLAPLFPARLQSAVETPAPPPIDSGTSMISSSTSARPRVTVNPIVPPS